MEPTDSRGAERERIKWMLLLSAIIGMSLGVVGLLAYVTFMLWVEQ